uniref:Uncharacterized protein n=1 Tax=Steinernema glaseri TaxID=37863 RepID=A0A1I8A6A8_9BILA
MRDGMDIDHDLQQKDTSYRMTDQRDRSGDRMQAVTKNKRSLDEDEDEGQRQCPRKVDSRQCLQSPVVVSKDSAKEFIEVSFPERVAVRRSVTRSAKSSCRDRFPLTERLCPEILMPVQTEPLNLSVQDTYSGHLEEGFC